MFSFVISTKIRKIAHIVIMTVVPLPFRSISDSLSGLKNGSRNKQNVKTSRLPHSAVMADLSVNMSISPHVTNFIE